MSATACFASAARSTRRSRRAEVDTTPDITRVPRGRRIVAPIETVIRSFGALIPLQPVAWTADGLVCVPDLAPDPVWDCPFPMENVHAPPITADSPARLVAGWYRRSDVHAPAPPGVPELVQAAGEGFGPADHPTTAMCLDALRTLPDGDALDVGCGSGLLSLAWHQAKTGPVHGFDTDPRAIRQARHSADIMGFDGEALFSHRRIESLNDADVTDRVLIANLPPLAHDILGARIRCRPRAVCLSGFTTADRGRVLTPYLRVGMRRVRAQRSGRFECHVLIGGGP